MFIYRKIVFANYCQKKLITFNVKNRKKKHKKSNTRITKLTKYQRKLIIFCYNLKQQFIVFIFFTKDFSKYFFFQKNETNKYQYKCNTM